MSFTPKLPNDLKIISREKISFCLAAEKILCDILKLRCKVINKVIFNESKSRKLLGETEKLKLELVVRSKILHSSNSGDKIALAESRHLWVDAIRSTTFSTQPRNVLYHQCYEKRLESLSHYLKEQDSSIRLPLSKLYKNCFNFDFEHKSVLAFLFLSLIHI